VLDGASLRVALRKGEYLIKGEVVALCPACKRLNELDRERLRAENRR
jgi:hypothetical protein